jgi:beta-N-acetylhexosaminidase
MENFMLSFVLYCLLGFSQTVFGQETFQFENYTLEEKVGQLLMVQFCGEEVNSDAERLINEAHVGGFIFYKWANGLKNPYQVQRLSVGLQKLSSIPLIIALDQEGGRVVRLKEGFMPFIGNDELSLMAPMTLVTDYAEAVAQELRAVGINMNLAPVVDVNSNPLNPVINTRSFGDKPEVVTLFGEAVLKGYQRSHLISCLKHFPGHGDVLIDSHLELPVLYKTKEELRRLELLPYVNLCHLADAVMTAHLFLPKVDPLNCASLSKLFIESILRDELGFSGIVVSDSLLMSGLKQHCNDVLEAAIRAINAGTDLLILGGKKLTGKDKEGELMIEKILEIYRGLVDAVKAGKISERRIDRAFERLLTLKNKYQIVQDSLLDEKDIENGVNTPAHRRITEKLISSIEK